MDVGNVLCRCTMKVYSLPLPFPLHTTVQQSRSRSGVWFIWHRRSFLPVGKTKVMICFGFALLCKGGMGESRGGAENSAQARRNTGKGGWKEEEQKVHLDILGETNSASSSLRKEGKKYEGTFPYQKGSASTVYSRFRIALALSLYNIGAMS